MTPSRPPRLLGSRLGIIAAVVTGFAIGAAGLAAAQDDSQTMSTALSDVASNSSQVPTIADDGPGTTVDLTIPSPHDDGPSTTVDDGPSTTIDDGPSTTVDDGPSTTVDDGPSTTVDDGPTTTIDDGPTTTIESSLPAPFTTSYSSSGGSIDVTWSGTSFTLNSVSPVSGFRAEIEHQSWDRVRVDFEGDDHDARIEVRINDGQLRVRID